MQDTLGLIDNRGSLFSWCAFPWFNLEYGTKSTTILLCFKAVEVTRVHIYDMM